VSSEDLDALHCHLIYGSLFTFLAALYRGLVMIVATVASWRLAAGLLLAGALLGVVLPWLSTLALSSLALAYVACEVCFFVYLKSLQRRVQRARPLCERLQPPEGSLSLFRRTMQTVEVCRGWAAEGCAQGVGRDSQRWIEGWFLGCPFALLRRGNLLEFAAWAWFCKEVAELDAGESKLAEGMVQEMEQRFGWRLPEGYGEGIRPIRINFDAVHAWCHPLAYYASIRALQAVTRQSMRLMGFTYTKASEGHGVSFFHYAPPGPLPGLLLQRGEARPPEPPVVFIHGLGVGLLPYLPFIRRLARQRECFVVEVPEVSQVGAKVTLTPDSAPAAFAAMLESHGHASACFVGHSYGTCIASWVARARPDVVSKLVLLDPVCFLLCQPDVAFNFLYRRPHNVMMRVTASFVRWELFAANVLMRHFYWYHNVLWREELPDDCVVALSSRDDITTNVPDVWRYLEEHQQGARGSKLKLLWMDGLHHGQVLLSKQAQLRVLELM